MGTVASSHAHRRLSPIDSRGLAVVATMTTGRLLMRFARVKRLLQRSRPRRQGAVEMGVALVAGAVMDGAVMAVGKVERHRLRIRRQRNSP